MRDLRRTNSRLRSNGGFTLVELLIAMGILLILTTLSVAVYTTTSSADRIRSSARQVQSALGGARDRQIKVLKTNRNARRGLRLLVDAADPTTVTSMVYVGSDVAWTDGQIVVGRADNYTVPATSTGPPDGQADSSTVRTIRGWPLLDPASGTYTMTGWANLYNQGLLVDGSRIRIPAGNGGTWYTVLTYPLLTAGAGPEKLVLTSDFRLMPSQGYPTPFDPGIPPQPGVAVVDDDQDGTIDNPEERGAPGSDDTTDINANYLSGTSYELELRPTVLPSQEPLRLSGGIAIDLYHSVIPASWYQQRSLLKGSPLPPLDQGWDPTANGGMGAYYYNGWGTWAIEGPDPNNAANDIYRQYSPRMDIMFSPQGTVTGPLATMGMIHLRLAEVQDIGEARDPANPQAAPMLYSTLFTQTGYVATFPVNITDSNSDGYADDPLYFARTGGTLGR